MRGEITLYGLIMLILVGSILSTLGVNTIILQYGIMNDYVFYNLQEVSEGLVDEGLYTDQFNVSNLTKFVAESYQDTINWMDNLWFAIYLLFIVFTFIIAYNIKTPTEINFIMVLLYGMFVFLFMGYITQIFIEWFLQNITLNILPTALNFFPKFEYYINNSGIINMIHAFVLLLLSRFNFRYSLRESVNSQELGRLNKGEIN